MNTKTYKREAAAVLMAFLGCMFVWGVYEDRAYQAAQYLTLPIFTFFSLAFGIDAYARQLKGS